MTTDTINDDRIAGLPLAASRRSIADPPIGGRHLVPVALRYALASAFVAAALGTNFLPVYGGVRLALFPFYAAVVAGAWLGTGPAVWRLYSQAVTVQYF